MDLKSVRKFLIDNANQTKGKEISLGKRAYEAVLLDITTNQSHLEKRTVNGYSFGQAFGDVYGVAYYRSEGGDIENVAIPREKCDAILKEHKFLNPQLVYEQWKNDGLLKFPKTCFILIVAALLFNIDSRIFCLATDAIAFFCLGYYIVKYNLHFRDLDKVSIALLVFLYAGLTCMEYLTNGMPAHFMLYALSKVTGMLFWARASRYFMSGRLKNKLLWIAKYNFSIYLFHELSLTMLKKALFKIFAANTILQESVYFLLPIIIIPFCIILSRIMEKAMPGTYRVLMGNRKQ